MVSVSCVNAHAIAIQEWFLALNNHFLFTLMKQQSLKLWHISPWICFYNQMQFIQMNVHTWWMDGRQTIHFPVQKWGQIWSVCWKHWIISCYRGWLQARHFIKMCGEILRERRVVCSKLNSTQWTDQCQQKEEAVICRFIYTDIPLVRRSPV